MSSVSLSGAFSSQDTRHLNYRNHAVYFYGDQSCDYGIGGFRSQDNSHCYSHNHVEIVDGDGRSGYMSHTSHSSYNNPCGDERRGGLRYQDNIHYYYLNNRLKRKILLYAETYYAPF